MEEVVSSNLTRSTKNPKPITKTGGLYANNGGKPETPELFLWKTITIDSRMPAQRVLRGVFSWSRFPEGHHGQTGAGSFAGSFAGAHLSSASNKASMATGLPTKSSMPASRHRSRQPAMASPSWQ